jgi:arylformamidase
LRGVFHNAIMVIYNYMEYNQVIDISLPLHSGMITYPNNPEFQVESLKTPTTFISKISMSTHTGTHIDVPRHVDESGWGIDQLKLASVIGICRVLDMTYVQDSIKVEDLESHNIQAGQRILVKTKNSVRGFEEFYDDYVYLDGDAAVFLANTKIHCFGIDSLSIKKRGGSDVRPHTELLKNDIVILEGLNLNQVEPGEYMLVALPLNLRSLDGAPTRVVLLK